MTTAEARDEPLVQSRDEQHGVLTLTMRRPARLNALSRELIGELGAALEAFVADDGMRVAVLIGDGGRAFSTGGDLKEMAERTTSGISAFPAFSVDDGVPARIQRCPKPVIAAIDGYCVAGGLELALACDIRTATVSSTFGLPEVTRGMLAGPGLVSLRRMLPAGEALMLHLTGQSMDATRAHALGLVQLLAHDRIEMIQRTAALATHIAAHDPHVVAQIKGIVRTPDTVALVDLASAIDGLNAQVATSSLVTDGVRSFASLRRDEREIDT